MRAMLAPIFGDTGAVIAQFVITLAIVLVLVVAVIWLVRRYSQGGLSGGARGRLPRLAIVDAMAVDNRRKLVLVRRDNVEHLILIGGPSDIVVEPGIMRQRSTAGQRQAAAQQPAATAQPPAAAASEPAPVAPPVRPAAAAASAAPVPPAPPPPPVARTRQEPVGAEEPIPFPPRRAPSTSRFSLRRDTSRRPAAEPEPEEPRPTRVLPAPAPAAVEVEDEPAPVAPPPTPRPMAASARFEETTRPTRVQPSFSLISEPEHEPELPPPLDIEEPEMVAAAERDEPAPEATAEYETAEEEAGESAQPMELPEAPPATAAEPAEAPQTSVKVSDLEKEMARLLGEISTSRSS